MNLLKYIIKYKQHSDRCQCQVGAFFAESIISTYATFTKSRV